MVISGAATIGSVGALATECRFFDNRLLTPGAIHFTYVNVNDIYMRTEAMAEVIERLDDWGKPAWITVMILGFIVFWPIGLAILAYLIWSGRMGCGRNGEMTRWQSRMAERWERKREKWGPHGRVYSSTGNRAFDEYREETLRRLEEEQREFRTFLDRLRMAKDKAEFDQFMAERRNQPRDTGPGESGPEQH